MDFFKMLSDIAGFGAPKHNWLTTIATFTGVSVDKDNNILDGSEGVPSFAYKITYRPFGQDITVWYMFPNGESPDPRTLKGTTMKIRFREDEQDMFEKVEE